MNAVVLKTLFSHALPSFTDRFLLLDRPENNEWFRTRIQENSEAAETRAYDASLEFMVHCLELRGAETRGHSERVTKLTIQFARWLKLPKAEVEHLRLGALIHDLGKMGVPDEILQKKGLLTRGELHIIHQHPVFVQEMLSSNVFFKEALEVAYNHHERWNGTGYPRGLKGTEIPYGARIFAVIDAWDALVSAPICEDISENEKARQYLIEKSGLHFDPQVVAAFFDMLDQQKSHLFQSAFHKIV